MVQIAGPPRILTFNGPLETGIRLVALLYSAFPRALDLQTLVILDYLLLRTGTLGGPDDLHPSGPIKLPATEVRRKLIQRAISLMILKGLIVQQFDECGLRYKAGEPAAMFITSVRTSYLCALCERAAWVADYFMNMSEPDIDSFGRSLFDNWVVEFQAIETSLGADE